VSWDQQFFDPIELPKGKKLVTLRDAATYIMKLPKAEHDAEEWRAAMEALLLVAESDGPTMFARIGVMRALNRHVEREFNPSRKDTHWGRRKLARDRWLTPDLSTFDLNHCSQASLVTLFDIFKHPTAAIMARHTVLINRWFVSVDTPKQQGPVSSRSPSVRETKSFPTESEAKQFAKAKLSEGMKVTAGTLSPHQPIRRNITAPEINQWIEEEVDGS
jgi:hypothetical protein